MGGGPTCEVETGTVYLASWQAVACRPKSKCFPHSFTHLPLPRHLLWALRCSQEEGRTSAKQVTPRMGHHANQVSPQATPVPGASGQSLNGQLLLGLLPPHPKAAARPQWLPKHLPCCTQPRSSPKSQLGSAAGPCTVTPPAKAGRGRESSGAFAPVPGWHPASPRLRFLPCG